MARPVRSGWPDVCWRRSSSTRSTKSWPATSRSISNTSASSASIFTSPSIEPSSGIPWQRPSPHGTDRSEMHYLIRHVTRFRYSDPVRESVMEVRMQPRTEGTQRCLRFELRTNPKATIAAFQDDLRNHVHHFDIPDRHTHLTITAEALVETGPTPSLPEALGTDAWSALDAMTADDEYWDLLAPSQLHRADRPATNPGARGASGPDHRSLHRCAGVDHRGPRRLRVRYHRRPRWTRRSTKRWRPVTASVRTSATS